MLRYAPGTPKIATYIPSCELIMMLVIRYYRDVVGEDVSSLGM